MSIEE